MKSNNWKRILIALLLTLVFSAIVFYITLPALNFQYEGFYIFIIEIIIAFFIIYYIIGSVGKIKNNKNTIFTSTGININGKELKFLKIPAIVIAVPVVILVVGGIISAPIFNAKRYQKLITVNEGNFIEDVAEISYTQIPTLDKDSAERLGDRKMGEMADLVSQFEVSNMYTQINYQQRPVRVTPLLYGDFFKWINNRSEGIPAYIRIDMVTQEVTCVRLEEGMKYSESEYFNRNIKRHLRFKYPTFILDEPVFEIDEEGNPYWICTKLKKTIGLFGGTDVDGIVICDAVTGDCQYYKSEEIPSWVDRAYGADLLIEQYDYSGLYVHGFWNSIFGQKDAKVTTDGYNYIAMNDDIYVYTGVTSIGGDESNIGFVLMNQRTKDTKFYSIPGAEEYSAMSSAEGQVQNLNYKATFPLLLNVSGEPTYFIPLKDNAGLVKKYSMVNVSQYQCVAIGDTIRECEQAYINLLKEENISDPEQEDENQELAKFSGKIAEIRSAVINGNTCYYIRFEESDKIFSIYASQDERAVMLNVGDNIEIEYKDTQDDIIAIVNMT